MSVPLSSAMAGCLMYLSVSLVTEQVNQQAIYISLTVFLCTCLPYLKHVLYLYYTRSSLWKGMLRLKEHL